MIRIAGVPILLVLLFVAGCRSIPDRMITADGQILSGKLISIEGRHIVFNNSETFVEYEEGRVFLREGDSFRGYISGTRGNIVIMTASGEKNFPAKEIESIVWSDPSDETTTTLDIRAVDGWVNTGLEISDSEIIIITAMGTVSMETGTCGPSGIDYFSTSTALVPGATNGELVMTVGESDPVAAGRAWSGESPGNGELMLAVNIPNIESTAGVAGSFAVTVTRTAGILNNSVLYPAKK